MKLALFMVLLFCSASAFGQATETCKNSGSGNWHSVKWNCSHGNAPGDSLASASFVRIADGTTVTCEAGQNCYCNGDDGGFSTACISGASNGGTGTLVVLGHLFYQGDVYIGESHWAVRDGGQMVCASATIHPKIHIGNINGSHALFVMAGKAGGARATLRKATTEELADALPCGGMSNPVWPGTGNVDFTHAAISDCGTATLQCLVTVAGMPGETFHVIDTQISQSGVFEIGKLSAIASFEWQGSNCVSPVEPQGRCLFFHGMANKTGGARVIDHAYIQGTFLPFGCEGSSYGFAITNTIFRNAGPNAEFDAQGSTVCAVSSFSNVLYYNDSSRGGLNAILPAGTLTRVVGLRSGGGADADTWDIQHLAASLTLDGFYDENQGSDEQGDAIVLHTDSIHPNTNVTLRHGIIPPNENGFCPGSLFTSVGDWPNTRVTIDHNTFCANSSKGIADMENAAGPPAGFTAITNNLIFRNTKVAGIATAIFGSVAAADGTYITADHNGFFNVTGNYYFKGNVALSAVKFVQPPGAHDVTGQDPRFVEQRRFLNYCQAHEPGIKTWTDCIAKFAAFNDDSGYDAYYSISNLYDYLAAGWRPRNGAYATAGTEGSYIGAQPVQQ